MINLLYRAGKLKEGYNSIVNGNNSSLKLLEFGKIVLKKKKEFAFNTGMREACIDVFNGRYDVKITAGSGKFVFYKNIGGRKGLLHGKPYMVYVPRRCKVEITKKSAELEMGIFLTPSRKDTIPKLIRPCDGVSRIVGKNNWERDVYTAIGAETDADRLLVGETYNREGSWSSYPPHKHDKKRPPGEAPMEEIYYFELEPKQGFGLMRIYGDKLEFPCVLQHGDTVSIPKGYHPLCAGGGYRIGYFWGLAGKERKYGAWSEDRNHVWIKE